MISDVHKACVCEICSSYRGPLDLYYGLRDPRWKYIEHLKEVDATKNKLADQLYTIDCFNNRTWLPKEEKALQGLFNDINTIHDQKYFNNSFELENILSRFEKNLYEFGIHEDPNAMTDNPPMEVTKKIRRACKFGIVFARTIHFVLDGFEPRYLLKNREIGLPPKDTFITTSELRFIYRHWSDLKKKIFFYYEGRKLPHPPWHQSSTLSNADQFRNFFGHYKSASASKINIDRPFIQLKDIWLSLMTWEMENLKIVD